MAGLDRPGERDRVWDVLEPADREFLQTTSLVRLTAAARWLGVTPDSLRRHVHDGRCFGRKFDGEWFVGRGAVERYRMRRAADETS